jgi:mRNA degradation ribonuclease J1/J2
MFLIQGPNGAVLHTGDIRCEPSFIEAIVKEKGCPLERFGGWRKGESDEEGRARMGEEKERLKAIYLDTSSL